MWPSSYDFPLQQFVGFIPPHQSFYDPSYSLQPTHGRDDEAPKPQRQNRTWTKAQSSALYDACKHYCEMQCRHQSSLSLADFGIIAQGFRQSPLQCMTRFQELSVSGTLKPGVWSPAEDELLVALIGDQSLKWGKVAAILNIQVHRGLPVRTGKKCKERWNNHLNPCIHRGGWTREEDLHLIQVFKQVGNRWSRISRVLGNRTESAVKNRIKSLLNTARQALGVLQSDDAIDFLIKQLSH